MTYCVGWKYDNSAYLVSDSAVSGIQSASLKSSFGENTGGSVSEATLKLAVIGPGAAITFAGKFSTGSAVVTFLKKDFDPLRSPEAAFGRVKRAVGPFGNDYARFLLARSYPDRPPSLTYWNTFDPEPEEIYDFRELGSLPESGAERLATAQMIETFRTEKTDEISMLPRVTSGIQLYGQHGDLIKMGVGGTVWGLRVCDGRVHWQPPTTYIIESLTAQQPTLVMAFIVDDILLVQSEFTATLRGFPFRWNTGRPVEETLPESISRLFASGPFDWDDWLCLVHLERRVRRVITICRGSRTNKGEVVLTTYRGKYQVVVRRGSHFSGYLRQTVPPEKMVMSFITDYMPPAEDEIPRTLSLPPPSDQTNDAG